MRVLLPIIFISLINSCLCQGINAEVETSEEIINFSRGLQCVDELFFTKGDYPLSVKVFKKQVISGHDKIPGDVLFDRIYLMVSYIDSTLNSKTINKSFWIEGELYQSRNFELEPKTRSLNFEHWLAEEPKKYSINLDTGILTPK